MSGIINFGLTTGYERNFFEYRKNDEASGLLYSTLLFVCISFAAFAAVTFVFKDPLSRLLTGSAQYGELIFWSYCATCMMSLKMYYLIYFKNMENASPYVWYTIDESILGVSFSLFLVIYMKSGVIGLVHGQFAASLIVFFLITYRFLKKVPASINWPILKDTLKLSYPLTPRIFLGVIGSQFDKYMINLLATLGGVGIYSIGQKIAYLVFTYMTAIQNVFSPQVYKRMFGLSESGNESVGSYLTPFAYFSILLAVLIALFSEEMIFLLTPAPFHSAADIIIVLTMLYGSMFFGKQPQLTYARKTGITSVLTFVSIGINIIINIPFIIKWAPIGAAWGTTVAGLISGGLTFAVAQHYHPIKWEYKKIAAIYLIFFFGALAALLTRSMSVEYPLRLAVKMVFLASYIYLGIRIRFISAENYALIKGVVGLNGSLPVRR
jgi:O-antigen/teichoic acid export membrane protein